jgi:mono/diheme cytochrome c family protein
MRLDPVILSKQHSSLLRDWMGWAIGFFLIASLFGVLMRWYFIDELPGLKYKNLLHAHSHVALMGWAFMITSALLLSFFIGNLRTKGYTRLMWANIIAVSGMGLSFPMQGYGAISIAFSTLHVLTAYFFAHLFLRDLRVQSAGQSALFARWAIYWMLLSTLGLWALGPVASMLGRLHPMYFGSIQFFLHFQFNGWFTYALLGVVIRFIETRGGVVRLHPLAIPILHLSLLLTFAQSITWSTPSSYLFYLNSAGVLLQALAYWMVLGPVIRQIISLPAKAPRWVVRLLHLGLACLAVKVLIQIAVALPFVAVISYTLRPFVIGFIHLIMLGSITFTMASLLMLEQHLPTHRAMKWGWLLLVVAFTLTELLLFGQGTLLWMMGRFIPYYYEMLFGAALLFPLALLTLLGGMLAPKEALDSPVEINSLTNKTMRTMKAIPVWLIASLLLVACGGGNQEAQKQAAAEKRAEMKKEQSVKGIGEIKHVDLTDPLEEAMIAKGKSIVNMKCAACHQLNDKRVVGPGFQGVTNRRTPEWIMNMITNVDVMLEEDPTAQALLEECLTRMPNQNVSIGDARDILEFLRNNDEEKAGSRDGGVVK